MRITNANIRILQPDEIFVFGSNLVGMHGGGGCTVGISEIRGCLGTGCRIAGAELCHTDYAGWGGNNPALCGRVYRVCKATSTTEILGDGNRLRDSGF